MNFSIIVPLYNEAENINQLNTELINALEKTQIDVNKFEIIYVDDGSVDKTLEILKNLKNSVKTTILINNKNLSQSKSILNGIEVSSYNNIILLDGDLQNDPADIIKMINNKINLLIFKLYLLKFINIKYNN